MYVKTRGRKKQRKVIRLNGVSSCLHRLDDGSATNAIGNVVFIIPSWLRIESDSLVCLLFLISLISLTVSVYRHVHGHRRLHPFPITRTCRDTGPIRSLEGEGRSIQVGSSQEGKGSGPQEEKMNVIVFSRSHFVEKQCISLR